MDFRELFRALPLVALILAASNCSGGAFTGADSKPTQPSGGGDEIQEAIAEVNGNGETAARSEDETLNEADGLSRSSTGMGGGNGGGGNVGGELDMGEDELGSGSTSILSEGGDFTPAQIELLKQRCYFAVSGTWINHPAYENRYQDTFPKPSSGKPIEAGETFDNVGGVFLLARELPYQYGVGGKEIDLAVDMTFDSFMVAPGMKVLIKDGGGRVLFEGAGPVIAGSSYYEQDPEWRGKYFAALKTANDNTEWITSYLSTKSGVESVDLHSARSVKVSPIQGSDCANIK